MKQILFLFFLCLTSISYGQFGYGATINYDLYQRYTNPELDDGGAAGSALLNLGLGPKIWLGMEKFSVSVESTANLGILGLSLGDYRGLGMLSIPVVGRLNFGGLTCLDKEGKFGFTMGGGIQFNRTELYYTTKDFKENGGQRNFFRTYVVEGGYGFGMSGFAVYGILRYGWDPVSKGKIMSIGAKFDFNRPNLKKITDPASEL